MRRATLRGLKTWWSESAVDGQSATFRGGLARFEHHFENMKRVFRRDDRLFAALDAFHEMSQTIGPWPVGFRFFV
jgi:hypothetical protein